MMTRQNRLFLFRALLLASWHGGVFFAARRQVRAEDQAAGAPPRQRSSRPTRRRRPRPSREFRSPTCRKSSTTPAP